MNIVTYYLLKIVVVSIYSIIIVFKEANIRLLESLDNILI